jgi:hypothetical protein
MEEDGSLSRSPAVRGKLREDPEPKPRAKRRGSVGLEDRFP